MNKEKIELYTRAINIPATDLTSLEHKKEVRHVLQTNFFNGKKIQTIDIPSIEKINPILKELKDYNKSSFSYIHSYKANGNGLGPGELLAYTIINKAVLGGGSSMGEDMILLSDKTVSYEIKAAEITLNRWARNIQTGRTLPTAPIISKLNKLREKLKLPGSEGAMNISTLRTIATERPKEYKAIEKDYANMAYDLYFGGHNTIFINNSIYSRQGLWEAIKEVKADDIRIERVARNSISPLVYIGDHPKWEA